MEFYGYVSPLRSEEDLHDKIALLPDSHISRMRVTFVVSGFPDSTGSTRGIFNLRTANLLAKLCDITIIYLRSFHANRILVQKHTVDGIPVTILPALTSQRFLGLSSWISRNLIPKEIQRLLSETTVLHSVGIHMPAIIAANWSKRFHLPHVAQVTSSWSLHSPLIRRHIRRLKIHIHALLFNSESLHHLFVNSVGTLPNMHTLYRGVNLEDFSPTGDGLSTTPRANGVTFLYMGGFPSVANDDIKGGRVLLEAWMHNEAKLCSLSASLIIGGPCCDPKELRRWLKRLQWPERVRIIGEIPATKMPGLLRSVDCVVVPSLSEGLPNLLLEAAACGKPAIGTAVGGIPEVIIDKVTGWVIPPNDSNALGQCLLRVAHDRDQLRWMGSEARKNAEQRFDASQYPHALLNLYAAALDSFRKTQKHHPAT